MTPNVLHKLQGAQHAASVSCVQQLPANLGGAPEPYAGGDREAEVNAVLERSRAERRASISIKPARRRPA